MIDPDTLAANHAATKLGIAVADLQARQNALGAKALAPAFDAMMSRNAALFASLAPVSLAISQEYIDAAFSKLTMQDALRGLDRPSYLGVLDGASFAPTRARPAPTPQKPRTKRGRWRERRKAHSAPKTDE